MRVSCSDEFFMSDLLKSTSNGNILHLVECIWVPAHGLSKYRVRYRWPRLAWLLLLCATVTSFASMLVACPMPYSQDSLSISQIENVWYCGAQWRRKQWPPACYLLQGPIFRIYLGRDSGGPCPMHAFVCMCGGHWGGKEREVRISGRETWLTTGFLLEAFLPCIHFLRVLWQIMTHLVT